MSDLKSFLNDNQLVVRSIQKVRDNLGKGRNGLFLLSATSLAACGGASGITGGPNPPPPEPTNKFTLANGNEFTGTDQGETLSQADTDVPLIVDGLGGNDTINTGSGADMIRGGKGADNINAGAGNDIIIVVGTTTANQYTSSSITNPAGSGTDLSKLISLANLNGQSVSEAVSGEVIDGGTGTNTLYVYGAVDFTNVTLTNVTQVVVNSDVTFTEEQLGNGVITKITGDGGSTIRIEASGGTTVTVDLSTIDMTGVNRIDVGPNVTVVVASGDDLKGKGVSVVSGEGALQVTEAAGSADLSGIAVEDSMAVKDSAGADVDISTTGATVVTETQVTQSESSTNTAPTDISLSANTVEENEDDAIIGTLTTTDADTDDAHTYTVNDERFEVVTVEGVTSLKQKDDVEFDYETTTSVDVVVTAKDLSGETFDKTFTIEVTDVNEAPVLTAEATASAEENQTAVMTVSSSDVDADDTKTYSLMGDDAALFAIDADGVIIFKSAPDFETPGDTGADNVYNLNLVATDAGGLADTQAVAVTVTDENTSPALDNFTIKENVRGEIVGNLSMMDDNGENYTITVNDNRFEVVNDQLKLKSGVILDFESELSVPLELTATDSKGALFRSNITLSVTDTADVLEGTLIPALSGEDNIRMSISSAGDFNGDGYKDIIIGESLYYQTTGEAYVVFGSADGFSSEFDLTSLDGNNGLKVNFSSISAYNGFSVSNIGDVNGDNIDDIIIGTSDVLSNGDIGKAYVIYGSNNGFSSTFNVDDLDGTNGFVISGLNSNENFGFAVSNAGDMNGDGVDDFMVSSPWSDPNGGQSGSVYVIFGNSSGFNASFDLATLDGSNGFVFNGAAQNNYLGYDFSDAGDVNGDGYSDVIIHARHDYFPSSNMLKGAAYVIYGKGSAFDAVLSPTDLDGTNGTYFYEDFSANFYVTGLGDVNGDGIDDLLIGATRSDQYDSTGPGKGFVVFGTMDGFGASFDLATLDGANGFSMTLDVDHDQLGATVSSVGDINGDGLNDIYILSRAVNNGSGYGKGYIVFGSEDGFSANLDLKALDGTNGFTINNGNIKDYQQGMVASEVGDLNGDGVDDFLIGNGGSGSNITQQVIIIYGHKGNWEASYELADMVGEIMPTSSQSSSGTIEVVEVSGNTEDFAEEDMLFNVLGDDGTFNYDYF